MSQGGAAFKQNSEAGEEDAPGAPSSGSQGAQAALANPGSPSGSSSKVPGQSANKEAVEFLRGAGTGQLKALARGVVRSEQMRLYPEDSALRLVGPNAVAVSFERETRMDLHRKDFLPTPFHGNAKYSSLLGARITFSEDDMPFNPAVPFDSRKTTLPAEEHNQMQEGMLDARLNRGPVAWGIRHGPIRV